MSDAWNQLLDAAIGYLENLKARGVQFVHVSPDTLAAIGQPGRQSLTGAIAPARNEPSAAKRDQAGTQFHSGTTFKATASMQTETPEAKTAEASQVSIAEPPKQEKPPVELEMTLGIAGEPQGPPPQRLDPETKAKALAELRQRVSSCAKCPHLAATRTNTVFGVGNIDAELMFIGEAPGADEDKRGEPFVGKAGELLTKIIETMGLRREEVYIANILKCRPDTPGQVSGNRTPTTEEMNTCLPYLQEQIDLIRPRVIVALGATAVKGLLGKCPSMTRLRGNWQSYRGIPLMPTYHPAYLLRNQALSVKREIWEDMLAVLEKLGRPITQKQRNYFLRR